MINDFNRQVIDEFRANGGAVGGPFAGASALALAVKFALELCLLAAVGWWGASVCDSLPVSVVVAIAAPTTVAVLWGRLAAPRSARRLQRNPRIAFELAMFALGAAALVGVGVPGLGAALLVAAVLTTLALERGPG